MIMRILLISIFTLSSLFVHNLFAQSDSLSLEPIPPIKNDSLAPATPKDPFGFRGLRIGADLVPPIAFAFDSRFLRLEGNLEVLLSRRFFAAAALGFARSQREELPNFSYQNQGSFLRAGVFYNRWHSKPPQLNAIWGFGLGFGSSLFEQNLNYQIEDGIWGQSNEAQNNQGLLASWLFFETHLRAGIGKNLYFGPLLRLAWLFQQPDTGSFTLKDVPGYGRALPVNVQLGYQIFYQFGH